MKFNSGRLFAFFVLACVIETASAAQGMGEGGHPEEGGGRFYAGILFKGSRCPGSVVLLEQSLKQIERRHTRLHLVRTGSWDNVKHLSFYGREPKLIREIRSSAPEFAWLILVSPSKVLLYREEVPPRPIDQLETASRLERHLSRLGKGAGS